MSGSAQHSDRSIRLVDRGEDVLALSWLVIVLMKSMARRASAWECRIAFQLAVARFGIPNRSFGDQSQR